MRQTVSVVVALVVFTLAGTRVVEAAPIALALLDSLGHSSGVIVDGSALDLDPADGVVSFAGAIGEWAVTTTSGSLSVGSMGLHSVDASATTTSTLFVLFTSLHHTLISDYYMTFAAALQDGTAAYGAFGDAADVGFGQTVGIGAIGPFVGDSTLDLFTGEFLGTGPLSAPYSLTQLFVLTGSGAGITLFTGEATLTAVPEPASIFLLGAGLIVAGLRARRVGASPLGAPHRLEQRGGERWRT